MPTKDELLDCFQISRDRKVVIWDPDRCAINDELSVDNYLIGGRS